MYEHHFHLSNNPFRLTPDPAVLFQTASHQEALAGMYFTVMSGRGFAQVTGEAGTGKTTLIRRLFQMLAQAGAVTGLIINPAFTPDELIEAFLLDIGFTDIPASKPARLALLQRLLIEFAQANRAVVMVIDEAHKLSVDTLEQIRLVANLEVDNAKLLQVVLVGQPELDDLVEREELRQLKQRISWRMRLAALAPSQIPAYVTFRWLKAGGQEALPFSLDALTAIEKYSAGVPRIINAICDAALVTAAANGTYNVDLGVIESVAADLRLAKTPKVMNGASSAAAPATGIASANDSGPLHFEGVELATLSRYAPAEASLMDRLAAWFRPGSHDQEKKSEETVN